MICKKYAFQSILASMKHIEEGWIPDFGSRYSTENFPYGIKFIKELAMIIYIHQ